MSFSANSVCVCVRWCGTFLCLCHMLEWNLEHAVFRPENSGNTLEGAVCLIDYGVGLLYLGLWDKKRSELTIHGNCYSELKGKNRITVCMVYF